MISIQSYRPYIATFCLLKMQHNLLIRYERVYIELLRVSVYKEKSAENDFSSKKFFVNKHT